jgi:hypothetical protein
MVAMIALIFGAVDVSQPVVKIATNHIATLQFVARLRPDRQRQISAPLRADSQSASVPDCWRLLKSSGDAERRRDCAIPPRYAVTSAAIISAPPWLLIINQLFYYSQTRWFIAAIEPDEQRFLPTLLRLKPTIVISRQTRSRLPLSSRYYRSFIAASDLLLSAIAALIASAICLLLLRLRNYCHAEYCAISVYYCCQRLRPAMMYAAPPFDPDGYMLIARWLKR